MSAQRKPKKGGVLFVLPVAPADASAELKDAIGRRRSAALMGVCPCGAQATPPAYDHREIGHVIFRHEADCPANDDQLLELIAEHRARGGSPVLWNAAYAEPVAVERP